MLVLARKRGEKILIGDNIVVKIVTTGRNIVKVGIDAPQSVRVLRSELVEEEEDEITTEAPSVARGRRHDRDAAMTVQSRGLSRSRRKAGFDELEDAA